MNRLLTIFIVAALCGAGSLYAQATPEPTITFMGTVYDKQDSIQQPGPIVVNKRTGTGHAFLPGGEFSIQGLKSDTFMVVSGGYEFAMYCFRDSAYKPVYYARVGLSIKVNQLNAVTVFQVKDLKTIKQERQGLGVTPTNTTKGAADALSSPITYMYERFSREGRSKALVAQLENEERKNAVLKDLFRTYNRAGVIALPETEFDSFILYLNMPESYLKAASDYELAVTIKQRYDQYMYSRRLHNQNQK